MFTEKELNESIEELKALEEEIRQIDAVYESIKKNMPADLDTRQTMQKNPELDRILAEANKKAEEEGRRRAANYRDKHQTATTVGKGSALGGRRRAMGI